MVSGRVGECCYRDNSILILRLHARNNRPIICRAVSLSVNVIWRHVMVYVSPALWRHCRGGVTWPASWRRCGIKERWLAAEADQPSIELYEINGSGAITVRRDRCMRRPGTCICCLNNISLRLLQALNWLRMFLWWCSRLRAYRQFYCSTPRIWRRGYSKAYTYTYLVTYFTAYCPTQSSSSTWHMMIDAALSAHWSRICLFHYLLD